MGYSTTSLETLLFQTSDGSKEAFREVYNRTRNTVYARIYDIIGNSHDAEDVMQETYVKIWRNASRYQREKGRAITWINAIAHYSAINFVRSRAHIYRARTKGLEAAIHITDHKSQMDVDFYLHERSIRLAAEIKLLPKEQQDVLEMSYIKGMSYREMSEITGISENTLKTRARRAILKLKARLEQGGILPEL